MERLPHAHHTHARSVTISPHTCTSPISSSSPLAAYVTRNAVSSSSSPSTTLIPTFPTSVLQQPQPTPPTTRIIHFVIGQKAEVAKFQSDTPDDQVKELFRCAAEAGHSDILKLYDTDGHLLNLSADLPTNTSRNRYKLEVVAAHTNGMLLEEVGVDLAALEERVSQLEKQLRTECDILPPALQELKQQVDGFRIKLETTEHLSWLGFYKQLPEPISSEECRRLQYRRKSDSLKKRVKERFQQICGTEVAERVRHWLRLPTFDSRPWEDEEVLLLLQQMFLDLDLCSRFGIDLPTLQTFIFEVYKNYNDVPFHNFRHCFCVAQMMYTMIWATNLQEKIGDLEILILLVSCICHDLDHPGFNNIYQINAKTELAIRYNDISPLENHHCSVAFRILENDDCNIFKTFSSETFKQVREGMIRCILATDMARHNEILANFKEITPEFDYTNKAHINLLTMVLIKVADISNEARPMDVAEPWLDRLLTEFFKQSDAEKLEGLPVTPFMDRDKITKPSSQCSFIGLVLLPLFEALGDLLTELQDLIVQPVRDALDYYRRLNEATKEERLHRKSVIAELLEHPALARSSVGCPPHSFLSTPDEGPELDGTTVPKSTSNQSVRSRKSISFRSRSRSTDEEFEQSNENLVICSDEDQNLADLLEDNESGDSETATEVEVSEKTLKFKISTESNITSSGRKSYPGSRKGSRDRGNVTCSEMSRAIQRERDRGKFIGALSFDSRVPSKRLSVDMNDSMEMFRRFHQGRSFDRGRSADIASPISGKSVDFLEDNEIPDIKIKTLSNHTLEENGNHRAIANNTHLSPTKMNASLLEVNKQVPNNYQQTVVAQIDSKTCKIILVNNNSKSNSDNCANNIQSHANQCCDVMTNRTLNSINTNKSVVVPSSRTKSKLDEIQVVERREQRTPSVDISENVAMTQQMTQQPTDHSSSKLNNNHRSFLSRIRQFTDRFSLNLDSTSKNTSGTTSSSSSHHHVATVPPIKSSKRHHSTTHDVISNCCTKSNSGGEIDYENDKKASTLPKINKQKSWKTILSCEKVNSLTNISAATNTTKLDNQQHSPSTSKISSHESFLKDDDDKQNDKTGINASYEPLTASPKKKYNI